MNDTFFDSSAGLVFVEFGGEGPATSYPGGNIAVLGEAHGALLVTLEHRFYGGAYCVIAHTLSPFRLLCFALLCFALLCFALLCFALLCFALLCCAVLCFVACCLLAWCG